MEWCPRHFGDGVAGFGKPADEVAKPLTPLGATTPNSAIIERSALPSIVR
jgi:hypothetical protein